jgi:hypothetical protein
MVSMSRRLQIERRIRGMQSCLIGGTGLRRGGNGKIASSIQTLECIYCEKTPHPVLTPTALV